MLDFKDVRTLLRIIVLCDLKGCPLTVHQGETLLLIGANGCGASRHFCVQLTGLAKPVKGPCHSKVCASMALTPQIPSNVHRNGQRVAVFFPFMSINDN